LIKLRKLAFIALVAVISAISISLNCFSMNDRTISDWKISTPGEQGIDLKTLSGSEKAIKNDFQAVTSLLVVRHGYLVYERYYLGNNKNDYTHVFSVTKSVISALTGIALREKLITGLDQKISDVYPEYFKNTDPKKKEITIKNLLTMTGGLEPVDNNYGAWFHSGDWFEYVINRPLTSNPGEKFTYNTGLTHVLGGVIAGSAKMSIKKFADRYLFSHLGITNYRWDTDPKGNYGGGHLLYLTPRDMAKFGYLYLKGGKWGEKQVVPEEWVKESTRVQADPGDGRKYGYLWWLENKRDKVHNKQFSMFSAIGYGGQYITVIPELDLVVVITCDAYLPSNKGDATNQIIVDYVIPSVI
jgi:CubicO group peptidase (beta-lactamase class C family)